MDKARKGYEWWDRLCKLPKYSFIIGLQGGVRRVEDGGGKWIDYASAQSVVDDAQAEINGLRDRLERLAPAAASEPPSASGERDWPALNAAIQSAWVQSVEDASPHFNGSREQAFRDGYLAALDTVAPSPGIDAAEPWKEYAQHLECCRTCAEDSVGSCAEGMNLKAAASAAPPAAQPSAAWVQEAERLADLYASACAYAEVPEATGYRLPIQTTRAALLAHLSTNP